MPKYEAHITFNRSDIDAVRHEAGPNGWKLSAFDADPLMGDKPFIYLTAYSSDAEQLLASTRHMKGFLAKKGVISLREKIERIVYDTKTGVNELETQ